ncbi:DUF305 domain-containing protein [Streptomyces minutiscleroticus]|uniref:DUF305 domain-containing protein n=1 Tax=Streptomyces minutiscleroticus TaxID=68238 RepID=A0A918N860_9ACTN|nr:DUF305 domain-containing protein [Streptomyces minutiscleroticus]GGX52896.1 DUF305 domain-containing protein [Streptomyces minutiscleroticus]
MRHAGRFLAAGVMAAALVTAGAITYAVADGDASGADGRGSGPRTPSADSADAGFARDMTVHHQQAVEMSFVVRDRTDDEEVRRLAYDVAQTQANQRGMLLGWLDLWELPKVSADPPMTWMGMGGMPPGEDGALMPGMATDAELERLGSLRGRRAEVLYLQLMTDHHKGGVHMAEGCAARCEVGAERRLARTMVEGQEAEIDLMADMLRKRGAAPRP